ncbi:MAG: hypothetical protein LBL04_09830 [Bacteroidales bacterium]|jgi:hypothetical protein|nr:hypothetical protein [Bacteroidales bacterium]
MKTLIFLILEGLALFTVSCGQAGKEEESKERPAIGLYAEVIPAKELLFAEDDIISFNLATREIIFTDVAAKRLSSCSFDGYSTSMNLFLNGERLFKSAIYLVCGFSSFRIDDLVFYRSVEEDSRYYLNDGYPLDIYSDEIRKIREKNAQKRKIEWNTFVDHLSKADKIIK